MAAATAGATRRMCGILGLPGGHAGQGNPVHPKKVRAGGQKGELDFVTAPEDRALGTMIENRQLRIALAAGLADAPLIRMLMPAEVVSLTWWGSKLGGSLQMRRKTLPEGLPLAADGEGVLRGDGSGPWPSSSLPQGSCPFEQ